MTPPAPVSRDSWPNNSGWVGVGVGWGIQVANSRLARENIEDEEDELVAEETGGSRGSRMAFGKASEPRHLSSSFPLHLLARTVAC